VDEGVRHRPPGRQYDRTALVRELRVAEGLYQPVFQAHVVLGVSRGHVGDRPGVERVELLRPVGDGRERYELVALGVLLGAEAGQSGQVGSAEVEAEQLLGARRPEAAREQKAPAVLVRRPGTEHSGAGVQEVCVRDTVKRFA